MGGWNVISLIVAFPLSPPLTLSPRPLFPLSSLSPLSSPSRLSPSCFPLCPSTPPSPPSILLPLFFLHWWSSDRTNKIEAQAVPTSTTVALAAFEPLRPNWRQSLILLPRMRASPCFIDPTHWLDHGPPRSRESKSTWADGPAHGGGQATLLPTLTPCHDIRVRVVGM